MAEEGEGLADAFAVAVGDAEADTWDEESEGEVEGADSVELHPATAARMAALQARARVFFMGIRIDEGSGPESSLGERSNVRGLHSMRTWEQ